MFRIGFILVFMCVFLSSVRAVDFDPPVLEASNIDSMAVGDLGTWGDDLALLVSGPSQETLIKFASGSGLVGNLQWSAGERMLRTGDFDGDGWGDLITLDPDNDLVVIRWGASLFDRDFNSVSAYWSGGDQPGFLEVGDLDGDGDDDWAVVNHGDDTIVMGISNNRNFNRNTYNHFFSHTFVMGDATGDGAADITIDTWNSNFRPDTLKTSVNNGDGTFPTGTGNRLSYKSTNLSGVQTQWKVAADMDNDGLHDIVMLRVLAGSPVVQIWSSDGNGFYSLSTNTTNGPGSGSSSAIACDLDDDGNMDILSIPLSLTGEILFYPGDGQGKFLPRLVIDSPANVGIVELACGDFNNDGINDIAYGDGNLLGRDLLVLYGL